MNNIINFTIINTITINPFTTTTIHTIPLTVP